MKNQTLAVIGIGYVGLPLACLAADKGYRVLGIDINPKLIEKVNKARIPFKDELVEKLLKKTVKSGNLKAVGDFGLLRQASIIAICVPTPVDENHQPDFEPLIAAVKKVRENPVKGQLVIIESTINPGVCEEVVLPSLEKDGKKAGRDFYLAHAPERINPGDPKWNVSNLPRNVGALSKTGLKKVAKFYRDIIDAPINEMQSIKEAEATKTIENAFRDINIAFINEIAKSFDQLGIDVVDVIKGASSKFSFMPHWPGCGVGGHCIPVDPYYLIRKAETVGFSHDFLKLARQINNQMPKYAVESFQDELNKVSLAVKGTKTAVLGIAYKADIDDTRESPAFEIIEELKKMGADVLTYDPLVLEESTEKSLEQILKKAQALLIVTDHSEFKKKLNGETLKKNNIKVILDGKNCLDKKNILKAGVNYKGIGR